MQPASDNIIIVHLAEAGSPIVQILDNITTDDIGNPCLGLIRFRRSDVDSLKGVHILLGWGLEWEVALNTIEKEREYIVLRPNFLSIQLFDDPEKQNDMNTTDADIS